MQIDNLVPCQRYIKYIFKFVEQLPLQRQETINSLTERLVYYTLVFKARDFLSRSAPTIIRSDSGAFNAARPVGALENSKGNLEFHRIKRKHNLF